MSRPRRHAAEAERPVELCGPDDGGWFRTAVMDWIALCEDLRDADVRGYQILRSLVGSKWANPVRKLSLAELCQLIPSPSGGPSGLTRVREMLRSLTRVGLVTTPEGAPLKTTSRVSGADKPLRIRVNDKAPPGYQGWRNAADKLAEVQTHRTPGGAPTGRVRVGRKSDPGAVRGRKSDPWGRKADPAGRKSAPGPQPELRKREPIFPLSIASSLSGTTVVPQRTTASSRDQDAAVSAVLAAWARGAGRAQPPASIRSTLAAQVPELQVDFPRLEQLQQVAYFAGERRWTDLARAALHPECDQVLAQAEGPHVPAAPSRTGPGEQGALLAEIGVTGTGL
ncbi:hypothetical protein [Streptomyces sp. NEAU-S7GS2]|uniref:hypothetical protein n=1 Tax=Streptomyces sp. NEAU-S7GS2 TaxID=2202000 RepID=UPI0013A56B23|nr:hypothetical protein [Streptomyces sp. NEAU-S7GS2]